MNGKRIFVCCIQWIECVLYSMKIPVSRQRRKDGSCRICTSLLHSCTHTIYLRRRVRVHDTCTTRFRTVLVVLYIMCLRALLYFLFSVRVFLYLFLIDLFILLFFFYSSPRSFIRFTVVTAYIHTYIYVHARQSYFVNYFFYSTVYIRVRYCT